MITAQGDRLVFECDICHKPVTGKGGWLCVDLRETDRIEQATTDWHNKQHPGPLQPLSALADLPEPDQWKVHHSACDPASGDGTNFYQFHVERCDTWPRLVHWTAHLMRKGWLEHTDWDQLLEQLGEDA